MDMQEVKKAVEAAKAGGKVLRVKGYRSSTGTTLDYDLELMDAGGYLRLVEQSFDKVLQAGFPPGTPAEVLAEGQKARDELRESFARTLAGTQPERGFGPELQDTGKGWWFDKGRPEAVIVQNLRAVRDPKVSGNQREVKSKPLTLAKNALRRQLPVDSYVGRLVLEAGKFVSVEVVDP
jgi:hypothetical protein